MYPVLKQCVVRPCDVVKHIKFEVHFHCTVIKIVVLNYILKFLKVIFPICFVHLCYIHIYYVQYILFGRKLWYI